MSKNTGDAKFRKINVDLIESDPEQEEPDTPTTGPDEAEVNRFLQANQSEQALLSALKCPPLRAKSQQIKDKSTQLVLKALVSFKSADIEPFVKKLSPEQFDVLMKYIYKGFEFPYENSSALLLIWHEKMVKIGGLGAIVRVLTGIKSL